MHKKETYKKEISMYIDTHKDEMLEDICTLCRINSEKMPYKEGMPFGAGTFHALNQALDIAERYGFAVTNYDHYVGTADMNQMETQLDILAHLDVVPAGEGWQVTEAYTPIIKDGKLYGRGTADDKGPAITALYAMRAVKELGIPLKKNVRLILGTDEECGSEDIEHYYSIEKEAPMTFSPDASFPVINIEKASFTGQFTAQWELSSALPRVSFLEAGSKVNVVPGKAVAVVEGIDFHQVETMAVQVEAETGIRFEITAEENKQTINITAVGAGAHASTPEDGKNALTGLLALLSRLPLASSEQEAAIRSLVKLLPHGDTEGRNLGIAMSDELSGSLTLAFSILKITDCGLEGTFDSRCPLCANDENTVAVTKARMAERGITLLNECIRPAHHVSGESDFVKTLLKNYEEFTGLKGECQAIGGGTYVHELQNGVAFGPSLPGTDNHIHGADEFAVIEELVISAKIFASVIADLCG